MSTKSNIVELKAKMQEFYEREQEHRTELQNTIKKNAMELKGIIEDHPLFKLIRDMYNTYSIGDYNCISVDAATYSLVLCEHPHLIYYNKGNRYGSIYVLRIFPGKSNFAIEKINTADTDPLVDLFKFDSLTNNIDETLNFYHNFDLEEVAETTTDMVKSLNEYLLDDIVDALLDNLNKYDKQSRK